MYKIRVKERTKLNLDKNFKMDKEVIFSILHAKWEPFSDDEFETREEAQREIDEFNHKQLDETGDLFEKLKKRGTMLVFKIKKEW